MLLDFLFCRIVLFCTALRVGATRTSIGRIRRVVLVVFGVLVRW